MKKQIITATALSILFLRKTDIVSAKDYHLAIYPPTTEVSVHEASIAKTYLYLENNEDTDVELVPIIKTFSTTLNESSIPLYDLSMNKEAKSIASKITIYDSINKSAIIPQLENKDQNTSTILLRGKEKKTLAIDLDFTKDLASSDYYFSLVFQQKNIDTNTEQSASSIRSAVASHFIIAVKPTQQAQFTITDLSVPLLNLSPHLSTSIHITNKSNTFGRAKMTIQVSDIFGRIIKTISNPSTIILAGSKRCFATFMKDFNNSNCFNEINVTTGPGIYKLQTIVKDEASDTTTTSTSYFTYIPLKTWLITSFIAFLILSFYLRVQYYLKKKIKK